MKKYYEGFLSLIFFISISWSVQGQTIRFQNSVRGGLAVATNGLNLSGQGTFANTEGAARMSSASDLVLPTGSTIVKAILYVEGYASQFNTVEFSYPGSPGLVTLTPASPGFIGNPTDGGSYSQFIIDVTSMIPSNGFVSTVTPGGDPSPAGRYAVADISPFDPGNWGYGWELMVVYTNPNSKYRNVTIADNTTTYGLGAGFTFTIPNILVPITGPVGAMVVVT